MLGFSSKQLIGTGIFLFAIFIGVPLVIGATGRWDFYFTLTSVALLAIASAGVWLTFYIGRINIGQGAFALIGAYVSAILVVKAGWSFWITLPAAGLFAAIVAILVGLPILRLRGVYFAMITLVLTQVFYTHSPRVTDYQWCERNYVDSAAWSIVSVWNHIDS